MGHWKCAPDTQYQIVQLYTIMGVYNIVYDNSSIIHSMCVSTCDSVYLTWHTFSLSLLNPKLVGLHSIHIQDSYYNYVLSRQIVHVYTCMIMDYLPLPWKSWSVSP